MRPSPSAPSPSTSRLPQKEGGFGCGASAAELTPHVGTFCLGSVGGTPAPSGPAPKGVPGGEDADGEAEVSASKDWGPLNLPEIQPGHKAHPLKPVDGSRWPPASHFPSEPLFPPLQKE